jgi:prepilin-type N-terminal cleavage/methylation domain-containing protein
MKKNSKFKIQNSKFKVHGLKGNGFTLVELLIVVAITGIVLAAVYTTFIVQQRSFVAQDQVAETQVSSKIAFDILVDKIRTAGFGYPTTETPDINGVTGIIATGDAGDGNSPDSITVVGGFKALGTIGLPTGQSNVEIEQKDGTGYYLDVCYDSTTVFNTSNMSHLSIDGVFYAEVISINNTGGSADCDFDGINETVPRLYLDRPVSIAFPVDRPLYLIEDIQFILNGSDLQISSPSATNTLASNIDDIQFAYAIDSDDDGEIDDQNGNGTIDPGDYINPPLPTGADIIAVRANLVARVANPDPTLDPDTKPYASGIILENGSTIGAGDNIRRRIWSTEIVLRNQR